MRLNGVLTAGFALLLGLVGGAVTAPAAGATASGDPVPATAATAPSPDGGVSILATNFQLPFPCGQAWTGNSSASSAHQSWEIDFNRGSTADADLGDTVVAAAAGTVPSPPTRDRTTASATWSRSTTAAAGPPTTRT